MNHKHTRIEWVDVAKGIAIMLVVIAHTIKFGNTGPIIRAVIYSFHMPFFFILSGITSSLPSTMEEFRKKTKKLLLSLVVPAYGACIFKAFINFFINKTTLSSGYFFKQLYSLLFVDHGKATYLEFSTYSVGAIWFLIVLFLCRTLLGYLNLIFNKQQLLFVTCLLSLIGYITGSQFHMIFAFDIALAVLPFCLSGQYIKKMNLTESPVRCGLYAFLVWIIGFFIAQPNPRNTPILDIFVRQYPLYPLCFVTAIAGTIFFCCCCILFSKLRISKFFSLIGKDTLIYLLIHYFDFIWKPLWNLPSDQYMKTLFRLLTDTVVFLLIIFLIYVFKKIKIYFTKTSNNESRR